jgi:hypothetical protein
MLIWPSKSPSEVVDYAMDWDDRLGCDSISHATFSVSAGTVEVESAENDERVSKVRVSGGTEGERAKILCQVTTMDGQQLQDTATFVVKAR